MNKKTLNFWDKLLPSQPEFSKAFKGKSDEFFPALYATISATSGLKHPAEEFSLSQSDKFSIEQMGSNPVVLRLLEFLVRLSGAHRILEIGTFIGVSAMCMARALPNDGQLVTVEKFDHFADVARSNFKANNLDDRILLIEGDAFEMLDEINRKGPYDIIFIDGNKERYRDYFEYLTPSLTKTGLVIIDDCFFHGDALNPTPETEKGRGVKAFLDMAAKQEDFHRILLPLSNGIALMMRIGDEDR